MTVPTAVRQEAIVPGYTEISENIRRIEPAIRAGVAQMEEQRRLPEALVAELRAAGAFRLAMPAEWGGPDLTPVQQTRIIEQISRIDASVGWCVMIGMDSGIFARYLNPGTAREFFPRLDMISAGWITPAGRANEVEGGYRVEGRWKFGSGCTHADVMVAGCTVRRDGEPVTGPDGRPLWRLAVVRPEQVTIHDTWHTTGLVGTGSCDYSIEDVFVPHEHMFSFGEPVHPGPLTRWPDTINRKMPGVPLGAARAALDYVRDLAGRRQDWDAGNRWAASPWVQRTVAKCELRLASARGLVYSSLAEQWEYLSSGRPAPQEVRAQVALGRFGAFRAARDVIGELYDLVGASALYKSRTPLDRAYRDIATACQHLVADNKVLEQAGQLLFGSEPDYKLM
jgi:indole-3-acetate monooxygenase